MASATWRYRAEGKELGPVTTEALCGLFAAGTLPLSTSVWCAAAGRWVVAQTIPGFRSAAALAPKPAPAMFSGTQPAMATPAGATMNSGLPCESLDDGPAPGSADAGGGFFRAAAKFARLMPVVVIVICCMSRGAGAAAGESSRPMNPLLAMGCVLAIGAAFVAGVVALCGTVVHGRRGILTPAVWGIFLSGLMLLGGVASFGAARTAGAQLRREGVASLTEYPGWFGIARTDGGGVGIGSYDNQSPITRHIVADLGTQYTVLCIAVDNSKGASSIRVEPSDVEVETSGGIIKAMDLDGALRNSPDDSLDLRRRFGGSVHRVGAGRVAEMICLMPADIDMRAVRRAILRVDGLPVTVPGRYMSAAERRAFYDAGVRATARDAVAGAN